MNSRFTSFAMFSLLVILASATGSQFEAGEWYWALNKPGWTPPGWLFGPVWGLLYLAMAVAAWMVWESGHRARNGAIVWWLIQLALNTAWSWLFFGLERPGWAMAEMALLIAMLLMCIRAFSLISRTAALLMLPYLLWLLFAWFLNFAIWRMNGGQLL